MAEPSKQKIDAADEDVESVSEESKSEDSDFDREYTCDLCKVSFSGLKPLRQHERSSKHLKVLRRQKLQKEIDEDLKNINLDDDSGDEDFTIKKVAECEMCDKVFTGLESYRQHLKSKNHKKKLKEVRLLEMAKDDDGKVNMEKLKKLLEAGDISSTGEASTELVESDEDAYRCEGCQKVFSGLTPFYDHLVSKSHKNTLKENRLKEKLVAGSDEENSIEMDEDVLVCKICKMSFSSASNVTTHLKGKNHTNMVKFLEWKREKKRLKKEQKKESVSSEVMPRGSDSEQSVE